MVGGKLRGNVWERKIDAEKQERDLKREQEYVRAGMERPQDNILFFDYAQTFMRRRMKTHPKSTWKQDELNLRNHILPVFSARPMMKITQVEIKDFLQELLESGFISKYKEKRGLSNATHNRILQLIHKIFEEAIDDKKATLNPASRVKRLSEKKKVRKTGYWENSEDIEKYISHAYADGFTYGVFATLALFAGPRVGEAIGLRFSQCSFSHREIRITRTLERSSGEIVERSKGEGEGGEYILPMLPRVEAAIRDAQKRNPLSRPSDHVLQREDGSPMSYWTLHKAHRRICKAAGVKYITIHDMRRTYASHAEAAGLSRGDIQTILGHGSIVTTENYIRKNVALITKKADETGFGALPKNVVKLKETK
jgi:integrase